MRALPVEGAAEAAVAMATAAGFWGLFVRCRTDIAMDDLSGKPEHCYEIRRGQAQALGFSLLLGLGLTVLCRRPWPILGVLALDAYMMWEYERAITMARKPRAVPNIGETHTMNSWRDV